MLEQLRLEFGEERVVVHRVAQMDAGHLGTDVDREAFDLHGLSPEG
ncbi:hypothetical protein [Ottowia sp.]|nr:hypothetical protein [Ottowia sp.]